MNTETFKTLVIVPPTAETLIYATAVALALWVLTSIILYYRGRNRGENRMYQAAFGMSNRQYRRYKRDNK